MEDHGSLKSQSSKNLKAPDIDENKARGFFDDACQGIPSKCGFGPILYSVNRIISLSSMLQAKGQIIDLNSMPCCYC